MSIADAKIALVVDDEPANRDFVERLLQTAGFQVMGAANGSDAITTASANPALTIALIDHELPDSTGLALVRKLRVSHPDTILVMATMHDHRALIEEAFEAGVDIFLVKPHGFMELYRRLLEQQPDGLHELVIDQYGPRPFRGTKRQTQAVDQPDQPMPAEPTPTMATIPTMATAVASAPKPAPAKPAKPSGRYRPANKGNKGRAASKKRGGSNKKKPATGTARRQGHVSPMSHSRRTVSARRRVLASVRRTWR